jgi:hypothetical protein
MYLLFVDESRSPDDRAFAVGGVTVRADEWGVLRDHWLATLEAHGCPPNKELKRHAHGAVVVNSRRPEMDERLRWFFERLQRDGTPYVKLERIIDGLLLGPSRHSIGLQTADLDGGERARRAPGSRRRLPLAQSSFSPDSRATQTPDSYGLPIAREPPTGSRARCGADVPFPVIELSTTYSAAAVTRALFAGRHRRCQLRIVDWTGALRPHCVLLEG